MKYFINFTNHPSARWDEVQLAAAKRYGLKGNEKDREIIDIPFPAVAPTSSAEELAKYAEDRVRAVNAMCLDCDPVVLVQGEMTLTFALVSAFIKHGIVCVAACSERKTIENVDVDGKTIKTSTFSFVQFREYRG